MDTTPISAIHKVNPVLHFDFAAMLTLLTSLLFHSFTDRVRQPSGSVIAALICLCISGCQPATPTSTRSEIETDVESAIEEPMAQLNAPESIGPESNSQPVVIEGPFNDVDWQSLVGRQVTIEGDLVVVDTFDLIRRGQVKVARQRLAIPTSSIDPNDQDPDGNTFEGGNNVAAVTAAQKFNDRATVILDDGTADENIFPTKLFPKLGDSVASVRAGSIVHGVSGRLVRAGSNLLLTVDGPLDWTPAVRPERPSVGQADLTIASFNVLNYFTTLDDGSNDARGADSPNELQRQEAKLVSAMTQLRADVIGLMEIENNSDAEERLVAALNDELGQDVFQGIGIPEGIRDAPGGDDSIRVGLIYRTDRVEPVGEAAFINDPAFWKGRAPLVQTFQSRTGGEPFTVIVNHFKSKGGADQADKANQDKGDGQAAYNATRLAQALAMVDYVKQARAEQTSPRILVIGDLNAYQQEDPIDVLRANGLIDLHEAFAANSSNDEENAGYSFIYYGQGGSLDHALATKAFAEDVTGVAIWHINADEPRFIDYNEEFNPPALFQPDPYRSSDHDPVIIGIRD